MTINGVSTEAVLAKLQTILKENEEMGTATCSFSKPEIDVLKKVAKLGMGIVAIFSLLDTIKYWLVALVVVYTQWGQIVEIVSGRN